MSRPFESTSSDHRSLALRQDDHAGGELDPRRVGGEERERDERIEQAHVRRHRTAGDRRIGQHHMIGRPQRLEAGRFRRAAEARGGVGIGAREEIDGMQSELHFGASPLGIWTAAMRSITVMRTLVSCSPRPAASAICS